MPQGVDQPPPKKESVGCFYFSMAVSCVVIASVLFGLYAGFVQPYLRADKAQSWIETPCKMLIARVGERRTSHSVSNADVRNGDNSSILYAIEVEYVYELDGTEHVSDRYQLADVTDGSEEWCRLQMQGLSPGKKHTCFVDPKNPSRAVLSRKPPLELINLLAFVPFLVIGLAGFAFSLFGIRAVGGSSVASDSGEPSSSDGERC